MMRKLTTYIFFLFALILSSCEKEIERVDGTPYTLTFTYSAADMNSVSLSRVLTPSEESAVQDLYIMLFEADEQGANRLVHHHYFTKQELRVIKADDKHSAAGQIDLDHVAPGRYYIAGVANVMSTSKEKSKQSLLEELNGVQCLTDLNNLTASLDNNGNVDRIKPELLMSGFYTDVASPGHTGMDIANITGNDVLSGTLHLRRVDSRIKFTVVNDAPTTIKHFELVSWQVMNVPSTAGLFNSEVDKSDFEYAPSVEKINFDDVEQNRTTFEFYLMENTQLPQQNIPTTATDPYHLREKRDDNGSFVYAPHDATYVVIRAYMEIAMPATDDTPAYTRTADVSYTIHLGYCEGADRQARANDFNCRRNTRYNYTIKIRGVDKIVLEATNQSEEQSGAEGTITDAVDGELLTVDAHYSTFNIALTPQEIDKMIYLIRTPFGVYGNGAIGVAQAPFDPTDANCTWIRFAETINLATLVPFAETVDNQADAIGGKQWLMNIEELNARYSDPDDDSHRYFTVFVDEYTYADKNPSEYVNLPSREMYLYTAGNVSADGGSIYINGKYRFQQRSIQSYYSNTVTSLLGIEHLDETKGRNLNWSVTNANNGNNNNNERNNWDANDGWKNSARSANGRCVLVGKRWDEYASLTTPDDLGFKTFQMNTTATRPRGQQEENSSNDFYEILYACLSRNRDENRNGIIDAEELKWYVPTYNQYFEIYMGAAALETPLFDASTIPASAGNNGGMNCRNDFHFAASDCQKIFAEQGCSSNNLHWTNGGASKWARNIRCVRNLNATATGVGTDMTEAGVSTLPSKPFIYDAATRTIELTNINPRCLRSTFIGPMSWLARHDNFNYAVNSPYRKFQFAKNLADGYNKDNWEASLTTNTICNDYYEEPDGSDRGTWRFPNQRELNMIWMVLGNTGELISGSNWKYDNIRFCCVNSSVSYLQAPGNNHRVRPVRDIR